MELAKQVEKVVAETYSNGSIPTVEEIQNIVEKVLIENYLNKYHKMSFLALKNIEIKGVAYATPFYFCWYLYDLVIKLNYIV